MIRNIQALRFFAAFAVMAFHAGLRYGNLENAQGYLTPLLWPFQHGYAGVDVFFVISGFVIWWTTEKGHGAGDAMPFLVRRYARIFIGYWPWLVFTAAVLFLLKGRDPNDYNILKSVTLLQLHGQAVVPVSWTLTIELMFYTTVAALMFLPRRVAFAAIMAWGLYALASSWDRTLWTMPYIAEFSAGVLLALWCRAGRRLPMLPLAAVAVAALALGIAFVDPRESLARVATFGPFSLSVVALAVALERKGIVAPAFLVVLGGASYALYLAHPAIIEAGYRWWRFVVAHPDFSIAMMMVVSLAVSTGWYLCFEDPVTRFVNRKFESLRGRGTSVEPAPAGKPPSGRTA